MKGRILLHLAAALAGWGIVQSRQPATPDTAEVIAPGKASIREARDRETGEKLLRRLVPDLAPALPLEVRRHVGTLEERVTAATTDDPFVEDFSAQGDGSTIGYLRVEIGETLFGADGPDLSCAFRHGRMEAPQVLATLRGIFPDLAGERQFAEAVFLELFPVDPARAVVLLDGRSPEGHESWIEGGRFNPVRIHGPEAALALLNVELSQGHENGIRDQQGSAEFLSRRFHESFGEDYTRWLLDQPPTKGREILLKVLARALEGEDPKAAADLKKRLSTR